jgi:hypothetical protein
MRKADGHRCGRTLAHWTRRCWRTNDSRVADGMVSAWMAVLEVALARLLGHPLDRDVSTDLARRVVLVRLPRPPFDRVSRRVLECTTRTAAQVVGE